MRIAVVDDSEPDRCLLRREVLRTYPGADLLEYEFPGEALAAARRGELPRLVLLDLNMERLDGFGLLERLVGRGDFRVCIVTSSSSAADRERAKTFESVVGFVEKPMSQADLRRFLEDAANE